MEVLLIFVALVALVAGIVWMTHRYEKGRTEELKQVAMRLGLDFPETKDDVPLSKTWKLSLFSRGRARKVKNVMHSAKGGAELAIFDYQFTIGAGQHSRTHHHTVVAMESDELKLPVFALRPEGFFQKIGAAVGMQDIDFQDHPGFSDSFVLKGNDERRVRRFFDTELLDFFARRHGLCVESAFGIFISFGKGRKKPEEIRDFMTETVAIYSALLERLSRS